MHAMFISWVGERQNCYIIQLKQPNFVRNFNKKHFFRLQCGDFLHYIYIQEISYQLLHLNISNLIFSILNSAVLNLYISMKEDVYK